MSPCVGDHAVVVAILARVERVGAVSNIRRKFFVVEPEGEQEGVVGVECEFVTATRPRSEIGFYFCRGCAPA